MILQRGSFKIPLCPFKSPKKRRQIVVFTNALVKNEHRVIMRQILSLRLIRGNMKISSILTLVSALGAINIAYSASIDVSQNLRYRGNMVLGLFSKTQPSICSGAYVFSQEKGQTYFATASHCFPNIDLPNDIKIKRYSARGEKISYAQEKLGMDGTLNDPFHDVVLTPAEDKYQIARNLGDRDAVEGERITMIGAPASTGNRPFAFSCTKKGVIKVLSPFPRTLTRWLPLAECNDPTNGKALEGISGGAVLNAKGEQIGVITGGMKAALNNGKRALYYSELIEGNLSDRERIKTHNAYVQIINNQIFTTPKTIKVKNNIVLKGSSL